jgi:hypothetical protein
MYIKSFISLGSAANLHHFTYLFWNLTFFAIFKNLKLNHRLHNYCAKCFGCLLGQTACWNGKKLSMYVLSYYSEKYVWLLNSLINSFQCYWQVLETSTNLCQQFSVPFRARYSRKVQTCYKPQNTIQRKLATLSGSYQFRRNRSSHDLEPQSVDVMTIAA